METPGQMGPIVDADWVVEHRDEIAVVDIRWYLDGRSGHDAYNAGHIAGALFVDLDEIAAAPPGPDGGRHPLPDAEVFADGLGALGIAADTPVVAYDDAGGMVASRLVWMLRRIGSPAAVLDGGLPAWPEPLTADVPEVHPVSREPVPWPDEFFVDAETVRAEVLAQGLVIDSRAGDRYRGELEPVDPRAGHIPGAVNLPFGENLDGEGHFRASADLADRFTDAGVTERTVFYCGSGVSACHNLIAAEAAGLAPPRLYVGSWSEWASDPQRPAAVGDNGDEAPLHALFGRHAEAQGDKVAVTFEGQTLTYAQLDRRSTDLAAHLRDLGVAAHDFVTIAEPNGFGYFVAFAACWKLGAVPQPVSSRLPATELEALVELADSPVIVGLDHDSRPSLPAGFEAPRFEGTLPVPPVPAAWKAPTSGGSTGRPKLIVSGDPAVFTQNLQKFAALLGAQAHDTMVMPGPLYHNGPLIWSWLTLFSGGHVVVHRRFDAESTLASITEHRASSIYMVPTMMQRIWKLPDAVKFSYDLSSLRLLWHLAEPCPAWLKEEWIDWVGPEVVWELYGGTEGMCFTVLDGTEWLAHHGSVGTPLNGELRIQDEDGEVLAAGEVGEVWMRAVGRDTPTYRYVGAEANIRDGWECLGDMGWLDEHGYLYLTDRRSDMILVGGANVFPAEIEAALGAHPQVRSSAVIGLPDADKGNRIHAIVDGVGIDEAELRGFLAERLVTYKLPRTFEFVDEPLRDEAGKVRRSALREARLGAD